MSSLEVRLSAKVGALSLEVDLGPFSGTLVMVGPNGAGKSSLLSAVLGTRRAERGRIAVGDAVLYDSVRGINVPVEERQFAWVPQDSGLFPHLNVQENVSFAQSTARTAAERLRRRERAAELISQLGLEPMVQRAVAVLSGGERQRVALARALAAEPRALLLDEPLASLDVSSRENVRTFLAEWLSRLPIPAIVVTHDAADARSLGQRIAVMENGRIVQMGTWDEITRSSASDFGTRLARE